MNEKVDNKESNNGQAILREICFSMFLRNNDLCVYERKRLKIVAIMRK